MKHLTVKSIKDFQTCERLYDYRYNDNLLDSEKIYSRDMFSIKFENTIKTILSYFWYKKQGGITPSYASLLNRWEKLWFPKDTDFYDITTEQHESAYGNISSLTSKAASVLVNFYEKYSENSLIPIAISEEYLAIPNKESSISDTYDVIYSNGKNIYVTKYLFNYKAKNSYIYQVDFSTMWMGFYNRYSEKIHQAKFGYVDLLSNDVSFKEYEVNSEDIDALQYWCDTIVEKEVFVPRRGMTPYCSKCPYDDPCSKWIGWK
jgi:hypothetical protein